MGIPISYMASMRALLGKSRGLFSTTPQDYGFDNNAPLMWRNTSNNADVEALRYDSDSQLRIGNEVIEPFRQTITLPVPLNAGMIDQCVFIAPYAMTITGVQEVHAVAGDDAGTVTINLTKDISGVVPGAGTTIMSGTFDAKGTANTVGSATLSTDPNVLTLAAGDRIGVNFVGTVTTLAGLVITLKVTPGGKGDFAVYRSVTGGVADQAFFIANQPMKVAAIYYAHSTAGSHGSDVNVQVTKDVSTNAPGAGTNLLTDNTNAGFNCKGTINVVQTGTLTGTTATLWLAAGDRLSVDFAGTTTALAGVVVVVVFEKLYERLKNITFVATANADAVDRAFWIADRSYRILDARYVNATAGTDGSAVNAQLTVDNLTDAPGAGVDVLSNNTNAGFNAKSVASTVEVGTFGSEAARYINAGDRLSVDMAGTTTDLAGVVITATLQAV
jgi:hypothetical protein